MPSLLPIHSLMGGYFFVLLDKTLISNTINDNEDDRFKMPFLSNSFGANAISTTTLVRMVSLSG